MDNLFLAYTLIIIGLLLMAAELFLPTGGIVFVLGLAGIIAGVAIAFNRSPSQGIVTLVAIVVLVPLFGPLLMHYWPRTAIGKKMMLTGPEEDATVAQMPVNLELEQLRGRSGRAVSPLRPSGVVDFDGRRIDCITEGIMVDPGTWVRCVDVRAGRVIVRPTEPPTLAGLENLELP